MATSLFDSEGLREFVAAGEGAPPPVFVGRKKAIADIEAAARRAWKPGAASHGEPKATRILYGAPGAGKSSILAELESRSLGASAVVPRVLAVSSERLVSDLPSVLTAISAAGAMKSDEWFRWAGGLRREWSRRAGRVLERLSAVGFAGFSLGLARSGAEPPDNLFALARATPARKWIAPVIVAVDEAQNLPPGEHTPTALFLQSIHNASSELPLTLALAGLGDTRHRAQEIGLTRALNPHEVGCLAAAEVDELMRGFSKRFGLQAYGSEEPLADLAADAEGWPRHLHFALQALGEEAIAAEGDLNSIDWSRAAKRAAGSRLRYYRAQQSDEMLQSRNLVAAVIRDLRDGMPTSDVIGLIEANAADAPGFKLPESTTSAAFYRHLVHQGALQKLEADAVHCPIPSFRSFLIEEGERGRDRRSERARPQKPDDPDDSPSPF